MKRIAIVGGGAAGFFLAVCLKERLADADVTIYESGRQVLRKVRVSGGGRCNVTNSFASVTDLAAVYPRGHRLMKRLLKSFSPHDAYAWWENHGVRLVTQDDGCVFPQSQDAGEIIACLTHHARSQGVRVLTEHRITSLDQLADYDAICITTGSMTPDMVAMLSAAGIVVEPPVPSLFSLATGDAALTAMAGLVVDAAVRITGTTFAASGALLITHWGVSGPAALKLSSYAARHLADNHYVAPLTINWMQTNEDEVRTTLTTIAATQPRKQVTSTHPQQLSSRLWEHLAHKAMGDAASRRWADVSRKDINRLVATLTADHYDITGRAAFRDEFVTCGGVSLSSINPTTLACRTNDKIFFAGEALDIDGITGGFNFQCAWTTAHTVAMSI